MSSSGSWESPSPVDDSDGDPTFEPQPKRKRGTCMQQARRGNRGIGVGRRMVADRASRNVSGNSSSEETCDSAPGTSAKITFENSVREKINFLQGKKKE